MAFDLVQYFAEQIETQKPELLSQLSREERRHHISAINALALGELITQWRANDKKVYQEITAPDELYILTTPAAIICKASANCCWGKLSIYPARRTIGFGQQIIF